MISSNKNYIIYKCSICKKTIEYLQDTKYADLNRCIITNKCGGVLSREGSSNNRNNLFVAGENSITDYIIRGKTFKKLVSQNTSVDDKVNIVSGEYSIAISGVKLKNVAGMNYYYVKDLDNNDFILQSVPTPNIRPRLGLITLKVYEITEQVLNYKLYSFNRLSNTQSVQGFDDSQDRKLLRFNDDSNIIKVFVNGLEIDETMYDISTDNILKFTPLLLENSNFIQIYVYNKPSFSVNSDELYDLNVIGRSVSIPEQSTILKNSSWGDAFEILIEDKNEYLVYGWDFSNLEFGKTYKILEIFATSDASSPNGVTTTKIDPSQFKILLGKSPYSFIDKNNKIYMPLLDLQFLYDSNSNGEISLDVSKDGQIELYNPIKIIRNNRIEDNNVQEVSSSTVKLSNKYILGVN